MDHAKEFPVKKMSEVLEVSRSGYYTWLKFKKEKEAKKVLLDTQIREAFEASRQIYGSPRIKDALKKKEVEISKSTVARRMKELGITPPRKKKFKKTTDSTHDYRISPNILNREFSVSIPGKVWVSDLTYIRVKDSFVYLTTVIDLADRSVVGWHLSDNMMDLDTTIAALEKALKNRKIGPGLIFHSDRGSQYASDDFRNLLSEHKCVQSMSRKGNCWDNAVAESFFKTIKVESLYRYKFETMEEVYSVVFDYIDGWYNTCRMHSTLGGKSPSEMFEFLKVVEAA